MNTAASTSVHQASSRDELESGMNRGIHGRRNPAGDRGPSSAKLKGGALRILVSRTANCRPADSANWNSKIDDANLGTSVQSFEQRRNPPSARDENHTTQPGRAVLSNVEPRTPAECASRLRKRHAQNTKRTKAARGPGGNRQDEADALAGHQVPQAAAYDQGCEEGVLQG